MTAASPGKSPAASGRNTSVSSTRSLRAAVRYFSDSVQLSNASALASTSISCLWRQRARVWGSWGGFVFRSEEGQEVSLPISAP